MFWAAAAAAAVAAAATPPTVPRVPVPRTFGNSVIAYLRNSTFTPLVVLEVYHKALIEL